MKENVKKSNIPSDWWCVFGTAVNIYIYCTDGNIYLRVSKDFRIFPFFSASKDLRMYPFCHDGPKIFWIFPFPMNWIFKDLRIFSFLVLSKYFRVSNFLRNVLSWFFLIERKFSNPYITNFSLYPFFFYPLFLSCR